MKNEYILKDENVIEIQLKSSLETTLLGSLDQDLVQFLRNNLKNDHITVSHKINVEQAKQKAYTSAEIFNEMAKKNPDLIKLKDALDLDTEY